MLTLYVVRRASRGYDTNLSGPLADDEGHRAVDADDAEHQRDAGGGEQDHGEGHLRRGEIENVLQRHDLRERQFRIVGRNFYNGRGAMRGVIVVTLGNQPTFGPFAYGEDIVAPYTVNADCTGTKSVALLGFGTITFWFVIDDNAREVRMIVVGDSNVTVSGTARKLTDGNSQ